MDNAAIQEFFRDHIRKYGKDDIRAMGWHDDYEYSVRYEVSARMAELEGRSILDIGCGFGGFYKYLVGSGVNADYVGVDLLPEMVEIAKKNNPTGCFKVMDFMDFEQQVDYVFNIGTLNIRTENDKEYYDKAIRKMCRIARKGVCICFLAAGQYSTEGPYRKINAEELRERIGKLGMRAKIVWDERLSNEAFLFAYEAK